MKINRLEYRYRVDAWDHKRGCYRRVLRTPSKVDAIHATTRIRNTRIIDQLTNLRIR